MVEGTGLENRRRVSVLEFESLLLCHLILTQKRLVLLLLLGLYLFFVAFSKGSTPHERYSICIHIHNLPPMLFVLLVYAYAKRTSLPI